MMMELAAVLVVGVMPTKFKDKLVRRIRELRNELIIAQKEHNNEKMSTLDKVRNLL